MAVLQFWGFPACKTGDFHFAILGIFSLQETAIPEIDAAFLDPDWAVSGPEHEYRFRNSNTRPPSDILLNLIFLKTENVTLIQPPFIDPGEFKHLPPHECEKLYLNGQHELFCLHFGDFANIIGDSEYRVE